MDYKIFFAWFFLVTTWISIAFIGLLLIFVSIFKLFHWVFIFDALNVLGGIILTLILSDYIKLKKLLNKGLIKRGHPRAKIQI